MLRPNKPDHKAHVPLNCQTFALPGANFGDIGGGILGYLSATTDKEPSAEQILQCWGTPMTPLICSGGCRAVVVKAEVHQSFVPLVRCD